MSRASEVVLRPWGQFENFVKEGDYNLKTITVAPGHRLSLQSHKKREEIWVIVRGTAVVTIGKRKIKKNKGGVVRIARDQIHRIESVSGAVLVEVGLGDFDENDIVRYEDDYGRV